MNAPQHAVSLR